MIIKELIELLKLYDENLIVIVWGDDYTEPGIIERKENYRVDYYTGTKFESIEPNTDFIVIQ